MPKIPKISGTSSNGDEEGRKLYRRGCIGLTFCISGLCLFFYFPDLMQYMIQQNTALKEDSLISESWAKPPLGLYVQIYMFNVTNPESVSEGDPPHLKQVGPYVLRVNMIKNFTRWDHSNQTVSYTRSVKIAFEEDMSSGGGREVFNMINLPVVGTISFLKENIPASIVFIGGPFNRLLKTYNETLIQKISFREMLVEGMNIPFMEPVLNYAKERDEIAKFLKNGRIPILELANNAPPENFLSHTGAEKPYSMGEVISYGGLNRMSAWGDRYCNMINGSGYFQGFHYFKLLSSIMSGEEGITFRHPVLKKAQYFFLPQFCRSVRLDYAGNDDVYGIPTEKFILDTMFISGKYIPTNKCFCKKGKYCEYNGTLSLAPCMLGVPITYSKPHFYGADPIFREMVTGLKPNADKHESFFHINTMLAMPIHVRIALQINMNVRTHSDFPILGKMKDMMLPIAWINLTVGILGTGKERLVWFLMVGPPFMAQAFGLAMAAVGIWRLGKLLYPMIKDRKEERSSARVVPVQSERTEGEGAASATEE